MTSLGWWGLLLSFFIVFGGMALIGIIGSLVSLWILKHENNPLVKFLGKIFDKFSH